METGALRNARDDEQYDRLVLFLDLDAGDLDDLKQTPYPLTKYEPVDDLDTEDGTLAFSVLWNERVQKQLQSVFENPDLPEAPAYQRPPMVITGAFEDDYGTMRFALETDQAHNDLIKDMNWEKTHHTFDGDDRMQWIIDATHESIDEIQYNNLRIDNLEEYQHVLEESNGAPA